ncbi:MAG: hypothetical protein ACM3VT_08630 [Solirubrobacterales bacterium]
MRPLSRIAETVIGASATTAVLVMFVVPGCFRQNQDNSPISINNSQGRPMLSVTCSQDGSVAYVADGRNVYRYDRNAAGAGPSWECIFSQGQRLEMAAKLDPREPLPPDSTQEKPANSKPSDAGGASPGK